MVSEVNWQSDKITLHYVDESARERARFAQLAIELGHHCEVYEDLAELKAFPPQRGFIFLRDENAVADCVAKAIGMLQQAGVWLPVIAVGEVAFPSKIVEAIKGGALDYIALPIEADRLRRCLARTAKEAEAYSMIRRRGIEAQQMIGGLSNRETEVLDLLAEGHSNKTIARELGISPRTVEIHRANMMNKLGATNAAAVVRMKLEAEQIRVA